MTTIKQMVAAAGPATALLEATAAAIGSGMVIGGFLAGLVAGLLLRRRGAELDHPVLMCGYVGGIMGLLALTTDWIGA
jgi:hypothetical protein